ncbi:MAG: hypothetical protein HWE27_07635 [Gammaproteobacteria bacterium]|nr:hypothetical protein [Gammaproteobacteria bacterium]
MTLKYDVVILTEDTYTQSPEINWYNLQVLLEDHLVLDAINSCGLKGVIKSWSDPDFDWSSTKSILFRTTWDYFDRFPEFSTWLEQLPKDLMSFNSLETIKWNMDKHYLLDLQSKGVNIVPTHIINKNSSNSLVELIDLLGWEEAILKPTVSGAARHTYRLHSNDLTSFEDNFSELIKHEDFMLQPFQSAIVNEGELSLIVIDGKVTHSVKKVAKQGDFRVQDDHGGQVYHYQPSKEEVAFAEATIAACDPKPIYARVDIIHDNQGSLAIMELELIEPELFFRFHRQATFQLADAIKRKLKSL